MYFLTCSFIVDNFWTINGDLTAADLGHYVTVQFVTSDFYQNVIHSKLHLKFEN